MVFEVKTYSATKEAPLMYSVPDAARLLGVSSRHLFGLVRRGEVPSVRLGRRVLISRATLDAVAEGALDQTT